MNWTLLYYIIPAVVGVAGAITIVVIYVRKIPKLSALDLEAMQHHRLMVRKSSLVEDRLARKLTTFRQRVSSLVVPVVHVIRTIAQNLYKQLRGLEEKYKKAAKQVGPQAIAQAQSASTLVQEAMVLQKEEKYAEAEKKYIEAIAADNLSVDAYRGLAQVYADQKDMEHAIETMKFLRQLNPQDEAVWRDLGKMFKSQELYDEAFESYERAVELAPNNPKNLDAFVEMAIAVKKKYTAQNALNKLREVNPENQGLDEFQKEIEQL